MRFTRAQWTVLWLAALVALAYVAGIGPFHRCSENARAIADLATWADAQNHPIGWRAPCRN